MADASLTANKVKANDPTHRQYLRNKNAAFFAAVYKVAAIYILVPLYLIFSSL